ncbi:MAG: methionyl-tRNA formyltransferase [Bacteroidetes bacterium]|nr:methionyl-tRNA formyltransferase [Bacteroidota bacterium]
MKIIFFGTPDFAIPSLNILFESEHEVVAVVTAPDKERGRGRKVSYTPVKEYSLANNIPCLQPVSLNDENFLKEIAKFDADLFVVVAFRILPKSIYTMPKYGSFNLHGSLLPKYRGAAPIQWAIINGDNETGVTTFFLADKVDTGNIIAKESLAVGEDDNFGAIHDKMSILGSGLVLKTVSMIENGNIKLLPQDDSMATPAPKITKETCRIDFNKNARSVNNLVRGLSPFPGAYCIINEKHFKIYKSNISEMQLAPGEVMQTKNEIFIGCGQGSLQVLEIQPEGRKRMTAADFLRGYTLTDDKGQ